MNQTRDVRILLIDHEEKHLASLEGVLGAAGYRTRRAMMAQETMDTVETFEPHICIIEPMLPDTDGFTIAGEIHARNSDIKIIVTSSIPMDEHARKEARHRFGFSAYLVRPFSDAALIHAVSEAMNPKTKKSRLTDKKLVQELDDLLENTLSGIDLTPVSKKTKKTKPAPTPPTPQPAPTVEKPKPVPQDPTKSLTSDDIFGALIDDIESGRVDESEFTLSGAAQDDTDLSQSADFKTDTDADLFNSQPMPTVSFDDPPPQADQPPPSKPNNDYQLLEKIASGGMAEVWKGKLIGDKGFEKIVAVKKILPHLSANEDFISMFTDEAKVAAKLTHPNIAQIYELRTGDPAFIAMEYVDGHTLRGILKTAKKVGCRLPFEMIAYIAMKLSNALHYAHTTKDFDDTPLNIVHRDVSPQNIIISHEGEIKLVDFGIAKASNKASETIAGSLKGKLLYMSPEQGDGQKLDNRSDIYSLGIVMYEMVTGKKLYAGNSELAVLNQVREASFKPARDLEPNLPNQLEEALSKALTKNPDDRYSSAKAFEGDLKDYLKEATSHVSEADISEFLKALFDENVERLLQLGASPVGMPQALTAPAHSTPAKPNELRQPPARRQMPPKNQSSASGDGKGIILIGLLIIIILLALWFFTKQEAGPAPTISRPEISQPIQEPQMPPPNASDDPAQAEPSAPLENSSQGDDTPTSEGSGNPADLSNPVDEKSAEELKKTEEKFKKMKEELDKQRKELEKKDQKNQSP